jgi:hypothetical protein
MADLNLSFITGKDAFGYKKEEIFQKSLNEQFRDERCFIPKNSKLICRGIVSQDSAIEVFQREDSVYQVNILKDFDQEGDLYNFSSYKSYQQKTIESIENIVEKLQKGIELK